MYGGCLLCPLYPLLFCIHIDTRDNHQILSRSQPARAFYCKRARHCIVRNNNAATHHKPYTCHKSTAWAPTAQGTNAIRDWHLTTETGNGLCERLNKGPFIWLLREGGGIGDLLCVGIFFHKQLVVKLFPLTYKAIVLQAFLCKIFFARNQSSTYFYLRNW